MSSLKTLISELESKIEYSDVSNLAISKSTVGWHIDHSLRVVNGVIPQLKNSNPDDYKRKFNFSKSIIFLSNKFPRGKAKAPKSVQSYEKVTAQDLINLIEISKKLIADLDNLHKNSNFKHTYFDVLNLKQTVTFLNIHTHHHLKIINDILQ